MSHLLSTESPYKTSLSETRESVLSGLLHAQEKYQCLQFPFGSPSPGQSFPNTPNLFLWWSGIFPVHRCILEMGSWGTGYVHHLLLRQSPPPADGSILYNPPLLFFFFKTQFAIATRWGKVLWNKDTKSLKEQALNLRSTSRLSHGWVMCLLWGEKTGNEDQLTRHQWT